MKNLPNTKDRSLMFLSQKSFKNRSLSLVQNDLKLIPSSEFMLALIPVIFILWFSHY